MHRARGFTLIELITVLVLMAIIASLSTTFVVTIMDSYQETQVKTRLMSRGRVAIEQMSRLLRASVPNSIRVSSSGNCLEFLPITGAAHYLTAVADTDNGAGFNSSITTSPLINDSGDAKHAIIGALTADEIYTSGVPSARASISSTSSTAINLTLAHQFNRNSITKRVFLADDPARLCLANGSLALLQNYGLDTAAISDNDPGGSSSTLATGVSTSTRAFALSDSTNDRNTAVTIVLTFSEGTNLVSMQQMIEVRNVP